MSSFGENYIFSGNTVSSNVWAAIFPHHPYIWIASVVHDIYDHCMYACNFIYVCMSVCMYICTCYLLSIYVRMCNRNVGMFTQVRGAVDSRWSIRTTVYRHMYGICHLLTKSEGPGPSPPVPTPSVNNYYLDHLENVALCSYSKWLLSNLHNLSSDLVFVSIFWIGSFE